MPKYFNVTGLCVPDKHYMVNRAECVRRIQRMVDAGDYFTMNRARQYGKTTTLFALAKALARSKLVISLDFQALGSMSFQSENKFSLAFLRIFLREMKRQQAQQIAGMDQLLAQMQKTVQTKEEGFDLLSLFEYLSAVCDRSPVPVVLIIDEVDSASDYQVFVDFLAQLRGAYLERDSKGAPAFWSVILASVTDIKSLKQRLRPHEERRQNSPWNIAADFDVDMELTETGIYEMLMEYEADHHTGMDLQEMAGLLYSYTCGYPYMVSRLCKLMDEKLDMESWTKEGFLKAVRMLLSEKNTLFESLAAKLEDDPKLSRMLEDLLFFGKTITYHPTIQEISQAVMFGFVKVQEGRVIPANRIFDTLLYNHFLSADEIRTSDIYRASLQDKSQFLANGHLNMRKVLEKFVEHFHELYGDCKEQFLEEEGRRYFLLYLRPIINGVGNYYIEARTRSLGRTDIIVDYRGEQFVIETKIWRGNEYHSRGESQLVGYLENREYPLD